MRRFFSKILIASAFAVGVTGAACAAESYPSHPIHLIIPAAAGSSMDPAAGVVGKALQKIWGQRVVLENRAGAGNTVGFEIVAHSKPDGYTILFSTATLGIVPYIYKDLPFDASTDFKPITMLASLPIALVASPKVPVSNISELINLAKQQPGKLTFGSGGEGTTNDLAAALLAQKAGIDILRVPYKGASQALTAVLGDEINFTFASTANTIGNIKDGTMKPIALTSPQRQEMLPNVPTVAETLPGYAVSNWYGLFAPKDLPPEILDKWKQAIAQVKQDPQVQQFYANAGAVLEMSPPEKMDAQLKSDLVQWKDVVSHLPKQDNK